MKMSYLYNRITIDGKTIEIADEPSEIKKIVLFENVIVLLMTRFHEVYPKDIDKRCRNIFAVSDKGDVLWQIERAPHYSEYMTGEHEGEVIPNPFIDVDITEDGILRGWAVGGFRYDIDIITGKLSNEKFVK